MRACLLPFLLGSLRPCSKAAVHSCICAVPQCSDCGGPFTQPDGGANFELMEDGVHPRGGKGEMRSMGGASVARMHAGSTTTPPQQRSALQATSWSPRRPSVDADLPVDVLPLWLQGAAQRCCCSVYFKRYRAECRTHVRRMLACWARKGSPVAWPWRPRRGNAGGKGRGMKGEGPVTSLSCCRSFTPAPIMSSQRIPEAAFWHTAAFKGKVREDKRQRLAAGHIRHSNDAQARLPASQGGLGPWAGRPLCCSQGPCKALLKEEEAGGVCLEHRFEAYGPSAVGEQAPPRPPRTPLVPAGRARWSRGARCPSGSLPHCRSIPRTAFNWASPCLPPQFMLCAGDGDEWQRLVGAKIFFRHVPHVQVSKQLSNAPCC